MLNFTAMKPKKGLGVLLCWAMVLWSLQASAQTLFQQTFSIPLCYQEAYGAFPTDTGYLVSLANTCAGPTDWNASILFLNSQGDSVTTITNPPYNGFIRPTTDGNLLFLGGTRAGLTYDTIRIAKVNLQGDTLWTSDLFFPLCNNQVYDAVNTTDGGYAITGIYSTDSCQNVARYDAFVVKLNAQGQELWRNTYGTPLDDQLHSIQQLTDGSLAAYGWATNTTDNSTYQWLLNLTATGDSIYSSFVGQPFTNDYGYGMDVSYNGNYITIGYTDSTYISQLTPAGTVVFNKGIGIPSGGRYFQAMESSDLRFVFLACFDSPFGCESHLIKTERDGTILWDKTWGGLMRHLEEPTPGRFVLSGYKTQFPNPSEAQVVVFDTTTLPFDTTGITNLNNPAINISLYPNPVTDELHITSSGIFIQQVNIINALGQQVDQLSCNSPATQISFTGLSRGIYLVQVYTAQGVVTRKVLVE